MIKFPQAGRVKTRLGREIGMVPAVWWFRHQLTSLIRRLRDPRWQIVLAVAPDAEGLRSRRWPSDLPRIGQGTGNLGDRMKRLAKSAPTGPVCIIGADIPGITRTHVMNAFRALGSSDAVLGPADDGGYWLIGFKRKRALPRGLFVDVRWSTEHALNDTLATMIGLSIARVANLNDVDTAQDLHASQRKPAEI